MLYCNCRHQYDLRVLISIQVLDTEINLDLVYTQGLVDIHLFSSSVNGEGLGVTPQEQCTHATTWTLVFNTMIS